MNRFEFPVLIVFATLGMLLMISANDLIALYVGLELQSLSLYIVAAFHRDSVRSTEAGLKYFVLGAISSGLLLYGCSMVYGFTGVTGFEGIAEALTTTVPGNAAAETGVLIGLVFIAAALAFKVSAVPFHMWTPDVYEGAPTPVTAFFAAAPKVAAMALLLRVFLGPFHELADQWDQIVIFVSVASMGPRRLRRHRPEEHQAADGLQLHRPCRLCARRALGRHAGGDPGRDHLHGDLHGNDARRLRLHPRHAPARPDGRGDQRPLRPFQDQPAARACARHLHVLDGGNPRRSPASSASCTSSLAAVDDGLYGLAIFGVLASVVGAYYYIRIVKVMYFDEPTDGFDRPIGVELSAVLAGTGIITLLFFAYPAPLLAGAEAAAAALMP